MENPTTWHRTTRIIFNALCEAQAQRDQQVIGYSEARIIHDALNDAGLLAEGKIESLKMERDGVTEQDIAETMPPKPYES